MKRVISIVMVICLSMAVFTGCAPQAWNISNMEKSTNDKVQNAVISMSIKESEIKTSTDELTLVISNQSGDEYTYGLDQILEVYVENAWYVVPIEAGIMTIEIAMILEPESTREDVFNLETYYKGLKPGEYRAIKIFYSDNEAVIAGASFEIK